MYCDAEQATGQWLLTLSISHRTDGFFLTKSQPTSLYKSPLYVRVLVFSCIFWNLVCASPVITGALVGAKVPTTGGLVGFLEGEDVGLFDGEADGFADGRALGLLEGLAVGPDKEKEWEESSCKYLKNSSSSSVSFNADTGETFMLSSAEVMNDSGREPSRFLASESTAALASRRRDARAVEARVIWSFITTWIGGSVLWMIVSVE